MYFLSEPSEQLHSLEEIGLNSTKLNTEDIQHLAHLIEVGKVPELRYLSLRHNQMAQMETTLKELVTKCVTSYNRKLEIKLGECNISQSSRNEMTQTV